MCMCVHVHVHVHVHLHVYVYVYVYMVLVVSSARISISTLVGLWLWPMCNTFRWYKSVLWRSQVKSNILFDRSKATGTVAWYRYATPFFYSTWPPSFSSHIKKDTDMQRLFYSTWPPSFSSHIKKDTDMQRLFYSTWPPSFSSHLLSNRGGERRWPQNKTGVVHRYQATVATGPYKRSNTNNCNKITNTTLYQNKTQSTWRLLSSSECQIHIFTQKPGSFTIVWAYETDGSWLHAGQRYGWRKVYLRFQCPGPPFTNMV